MRVRRIVDTHRDDLVVAALVVDHAQPTDRTRVDDRERLDRLLHEHEDMSGSSSSPWVRGMNP